MCSGESSRCCSCSLLSKTTSRRHTGRFSAEHLLVDNFEGNFVMMVERGPYGRLCGSTAAVARVKYLARVHPR